MSIDACLNKLTAIAAAGLLLGMPVSYAQERKISETHDAEYVTPLPLSTSGEKIDVLVRVKNEMRGHYFNLVFVEKANWPQSKKDNLRKIFDGRSSIKQMVEPYPIKLRFRLDAHKPNNFLSVDAVIAERNGLYVTRTAKDGAEIWRAHVIYGAVLKPGIYRVRIENLTPISEIDFETLFAFERDNRKY